MDNAVITRKNIGDKSQDAAPNTADKVKGKVNRDIGRTQQALEDTID